jgi:peptidylprolyl isomerase
MSTAKNGDKVKVHYTGTLDDGSVFDSSEGRDPLEFTLGSGQVIPGFDNGVSGMNIGDKKTIQIPCIEAYGEYRDELVFDITNENIPEGFVPTIGQQVQLGKEDGNFIIATICEIKTDAITLDGNHPLAGKDLTFDVELVALS